MDEVKSAYRRLAKDFHPDHYSGSNDMFREIQEAYSVLGDPNLRHQYENKIRKKSIKIPVRQPSDPEPLIPEESKVGVEEISPVRSFQQYTPSVDEIFDWLWGNFSSLDQSKSGRIENLTLEVPLTSEQALIGGNAKVMVPVHAACPACQGFGNIGMYTCSRCAGEGAIAGEMPIIISFPSGLTKDHAVIVPLDRFGIRNIHMVVLFRPTGAEEL